MPVLLLVIHFICPLVFFTNFTRNPYQTQITLLHLCVLSLLSYWSIRSLVSWRKQQAAVAAPAGFSYHALVPLAAFTLICWVSWLHSYLTHPAYFRESVIAEGLRVNLFWLVNSLGPLAIGIVMGLEAKQKRRGMFKLDWQVFLGGALFALGWVFYHRLRAPDPSPLETSLLAYLWDPYAFFLWTAALGWFLYRYSVIGQDLFFNLSYLVGVIASVYGIGQYFGWDVVWARVMNPYGARAISTFGNPNFLSPFLTLFMPVFIAGFWQAKGKGERYAFAALFLLFEAGLFSTLTRSSWMAAVVGTGFVGCFCWRRSDAGRKKMLGVIFALAAAMFFVWPRGAGSVTPNPVGRILEMRDAVEVASDGSGTIYAPYTQRVLIWSTCWQYVRERPLLGKGWGLLELFYPFYQGSMLYVKKFEPLRTHANNGHNEIIEIWTQTGTIGMGLALWFVVLFLALAYKNTVHVEEEGGLRMTAIGIAGGFLAMMVDNLLNVSLHFAVPGYFFWWFVGIFLALAPAVRPGIFLSAYRAALSRPALRAAAGVCALSIAGFCGQYFFRVWFAEYHYFRGFVLHRETRLQPALERLLKSQAIFPAEVNRNYEIGNVYARLGNIERAIWAYDRALAANAGYDEIYFNKATLLFKSERYEDAKANYLISLLINPTNRLAYAGLTNIFLRDTIRYAPDGVRVLSRASHFFPKDTEILNNLGSFYSQARNSEHAIDSFLKVLAVDPRHSSAINNMLIEIKRLLADGKREDASRVLERWIMVVPGLQLPPALAALRRL